MASSFQNLVEALRARAGTVAVDPAFHQALDHALDAHAAERKELDGAREAAAQAHAAVAGLQSQIDDLKANPPTVDLSEVTSRLSELEGRATAAAEPAKAPSPKPTTTPKAPAAKPKPAAKKKS